MKRLILFVLGLSVTLRAEVSLSVQEIVHRSVEANQRDWNASPEYAHQEREITKSDDQVTDRTYQVITMDGTPYRRLIAIDGKPLPKAREQQEIQKEKQELARRRSETKSERDQRIQKFQKSRAADNLLMTQMATAFNFHPAADENIDGRACYVLTAEPKPDYRPVNHEAKVLTGMRGKLWIDKAQFHWAKVEAEVIHTVTYGGFLAHVSPGTRFMLQKSPVADDIWQAERFEVHVEASILFWQKKTVTTDLFRDYKPRVISRLEPGMLTPFKIELEAQKLQQIAKSNDRQEAVPVDNQQAGEPGVAHFRKRRDGIGIW
jgi:hypothetical protein